MQSIEMQEDDNLLVLSFVDRKITDQQRITQIDAALQYATGLAADGRVLVDFSGLSFMSSAMIGALLRFQKKCDGESINVKFCNIGNDIEEIFRTMKLKKIFSIHKTREQAVKAYEKKGWFG